jgi:hypothetical protein
MWRRTLAVSDAVHRLRLVLGYKEIFFEQFALVSNTCFLIYRKDLIYKEKIFFVFMPQIGNDTDFRVKLQTASASTSTDIGYNENMTPEGEMFMKFFL